jgi:hypothetical protein
MLDSYVVWSMAASTSRNGKLRARSAEQGKDGSMKTYEFTLAFRLPRSDADPTTFLDALFETGCDDATPGVGRRGTIALVFSREAATAERAVQSAADDVLRAIPGAELVEAKPDLVNLADVADMVGCSRQNMRKYAAGEIRSLEVAFPEPVFTGSPSLWRLVEVLGWLDSHTDLHPSSEALETARAVGKLNLTLQSRRFAGIAA